MNALPKVSVVTIVRNDPEGFAATARSILFQQYRNIEWIVIDGLSTDHTSLYVRQLSPFISRYKIEKDSGIYNAMNKGIDLLTGEWVFFMNAGDIFFNESIVSTYMKSIRDGDDIIYSDVLRQEDGKIHKYRPADQWWAGMIFDHQSSCVRSAIYKELRYREEFAVAGDFDFFSRARVAGCSFRRLPGIISCIKPFATGASSNYFERQKERVKVLATHFPSKKERTDLLVREWKNALAAEQISGEEFKILTDMIFNT